VKGRLRGGPTFKSYFVYILSIAREIVSPPLFESVIDSPPATLRTWRANVVLREDLKE
jgi:hypothetical protein